MVIGGIDPTGGAGLARDLLTLQELGCSGAAAVSALTVQDSGGVRSVYATAPRALSEQIRVAVAAAPIQAVKIGMLATKENVHAAASSLKKHRLAPVVLDPVLSATAGGALLAEDAVAILVEELLPLATVVTPNAPESEILSGRPVQTVGDMKQAARDIHQLGPAWVLVKGGHLPGDKSTDILYNGEQFYQFAQAKSPGHVRGTGCMLASALAAHLGDGDTVPKATELARRFVFEKIKGPDT